MTGEPIRSGKIRIGRIKPADVTIRMLLPDTTRPMVLPCRADDLAGDPDFRNRTTRVTARHAHAVLGTLQELTHLGLLETWIAQRGAPGVMKDDLADPHDLNESVA